MSWQSMVLLAPGVQSGSSNQRITSVGGKGVRSHPGNILPTPAGLASCREQEAWPEVRPGGSFLPGVKAQNSEYFPQKRRVKGAGIPMASQRVAQGSYPPPPQGKATLQSPRTSQLWVYLLGVPWRSHCSQSTNTCGLVNTDSREGLWPQSHTVKRQRTWEPNLKGSDTPCHLLFPLFQGLLNVLSFSSILPRGVLQHLPS